MSMQDPISDMLTSIRNSQMANKIFVCVPSSNLKIAIAKVLQQEGYISNYVMMKNKHHLILKIFLKYFNGKSVIENIKRISKPSLRIYKSNKDLPVVMDGLGILILSTSKGVISNKTANKIGIGGEVICSVY
ncbi:30S ribosomal protein S8 [Buchnera aphidicola]|uniref:30S ribosomal protein S8 n=1 Tax=Buchnera aphidicola TaxID=9 RepID=UPI003463E939